MYIFFIFLILIFKPNSLIKVNIKNNSFAMRKPSQSTTLNNHKKKNGFVNVHTNATSQAVYIQKIYRAYHSRKYLQGFKVMPRDVQERILFYIRETFYNNKYNKSLQKILCKRFDTLVGTPESLNYGNNPSIFMEPYRLKIVSMNQYEFWSYLIELNELYKLYTKYITIIPKEYNTLYTISNIVKKYLETCPVKPGDEVQYYTWTQEELIEIQKNMGQLQSNIKTYKNVFEIHDNNFNNNI